MLPFFINGEYDSVSNYLMNTYNRLPVTFTHGEGCYVYDTEGKEYIDALCGISVTNLGHAHPAFQG